MIATPFEYLAPESLGAALAALAEDSEGTAILGGGTWLVPDLDSGARRARRVLDLAGLGLNRIDRGEDGSLRVGAMCTYTQLADAPSPLLAMMAAQITGGAAIRNQATIGGSLVAARAQSDAPAAAIAARAVAVLASAGGERRVGVHELAPRRDEILVALELPPPAPGNGYRKLKLGASSWPIATAAAAVGPERMLVVLGGVSASPIRIEALRPEELTVTVEHPFEDALAPAAYRAAVAAPLARRALEDALRRCG